MCVCVCVWGGGGGGGGCSRKPLKGTLNLSILGADRDLFNVILRSFPRTHPETRARSQDAALVNKQVADFSTFCSRTSTASSIERFRLTLSIPPSTATVARDFRFRISSYTAFLKRQSL